MGDNTVEIDEAILSKVRQARDDADQAAAEAKGYVGGLRNTALAQPFGTSTGGRHLASVFQHAVDTLDGIVTNTAESAAILASGTVDAVLTTRSMTDESVERFNSLAQQSKESATAAMTTYLPSSAVPGAGGATTDPGASGGSTTSATGPGAGAGS